MKRILILAAIGLVFVATACTQEANQPAPAVEPKPQANAVPQPKVEAPAAEAISYELKVEGMT
ncbi:MAG: hypothetical protein M5U25_14120 [Planctomycetota bacterium]|nr:hypothetical protein [Planctomycetota bacterium]